MSDVPPVSPTGQADPRATAEDWFLLATCRGGAEATLAARQEDVLPGLRRGAWRRGIVTFRVPSGEPSDAFEHDLVFARACVRSLGQVGGGSDEARAAATVTLAGPAPWRAVHVWPRDGRVEADVASIARVLGDALGVEDAGGVARPGDLVLDCVVDSAERWWIGRHRATVPPTTWPGGIAPAVLPEGTVSRAWLKLDEAIAVFSLPLEQGQRAIEVGAAPGGACQRLLAAGLDVVGIDPAVVDARVATHPRFRQWRMRARDVKRRAFRGCDWLVCDMNIDPTSTMAALERILTTPGVRPVGVIATLKLPEWSRAEALPGWLDSFMAWGYVPRARQLSTGGREVCVAALRSVPRGAVGGVRSRATRRPGR